MQFSQRKLLILYNSTHSPMDCGRKCSPTPSPHRSPLSLPEPAKLSFHHSDRTTQIHLIRVSTLAVASTIGVIFLLYSVIKILGHYYSRRFHNSRRRNSPILFDVYGGDSSFSDDEGPPINHPIWFINTVGLQQSVIDSIAVFRFRKGEGIVEVTECSVCLSEFQEDDCVRLLPKCSHAFHVSCIDTWLRSHKNCPLCRAPIVREASSRREVGTVLDSSNSNSVEIRTEIMTMDGVGEGESSEVRVEDDDDDDDDSRIMMIAEDGEDCEVSDKNMEKMNCHSARVSRSDSPNTSCSA